MVTATLKATMAISAQDQIGDGPVWDADTQRLTWVDHGRRMMHEAKAQGGGGWTETHRWTYDGPISYALPRTRGGCAIAVGNEIVLWEAGSRTVFTRLDVDATHLRFNDMKCDARGRLWAGTFSPDFSRRGTLYRIDHDGTPVAMLEDVLLANGLEWSLDGGTFYFVDSLKFTVDAFDFDLERGTLANRRTFITLKPDEGGPNGITIDDEGCLWVAVTCGGEVRRYAPDGSLLARVLISVPGATSCCFGGPQGRDLFITSRSGRVPEIIKSMGVPEARMESNGPQAGALFVCQPGVSGPAARAFGS